ncbi:aspartyl protease family protein [Maribellus maritimus]|uniref:aspartyl protease family protein n=1 Tax=Maribellus maritimus TaxID=2870838 RepID=UPI001EEA63C4|nr:aspartyl protease family protein [Maribellus maritimus]MCG6191101.1 aspartyl protease family protein [Maribellus maritimus]
MNRTVIVSLLVGYFLFFSQSCTQSWTKAIQKGKIQDGSFFEIIYSENENGLLTVPVEIDGEKYRFLFDTGAILSISEKVQKKLNFKTVSRGNIVDSDNHKTRVKYVQIDTLFIGEIPFFEQTAFVTDLDKNPVIACMNIDGIIGSNLMRHCSWAIDYQNNQIALFNDTINLLSNAGYQIPFRSDNQYSQLLQFEFGKAKLKNLKLDYGSNGSITLPKKGFEVLKQHEIVEKTAKVSGYSQSGISGKVSELKGELALADTIKAGDLKIPEVEIKTGKSGLLGTEVLSRFIVSIDFKTQTIFLEPVDDTFPDYSTFGFNVGYSGEKQMYVMQVVENSSAEKAGVTPGMQILKVDSLLFNSNSPLCDFIQYNSLPKENITLELLDKSGKREKVDLRKTKIF